MDISRVSLGPNIPIDGLTVLYDFSNIKSYPGTGTTVYDLSPKSGINNGTLYNTPTHVSGVPGYMSFAGASSESLTYSINLGQAFSAFIVAKAPGTSWSNYGNLIGGNTVTSPNSNNNGFSISVGFGNVYFNVNDSSAAGGPVTNITPGISKIHLYYLTYDHVDTVITGYDDKITLNTGLYFAGRTSNESMSITMAADDTNTQYYTNMNIYYHMLYNRGLNSDEILRIYSAFKTRFGLS